MREIISKNSVEGVHLPIRLWVSFLSVPPFPQCLSPAGSSREGQIFGSTFARGRGPPRPRGRSELGNPNQDGAAAGAAGTLCPGVSAGAAARGALPGGRRLRGLPVPGGTGPGHPGLAPGQPRASESGTRRGAKMRLKSSGGPLATPPLPSTTLNFSS